MSSTWRSSADPTVSLRLQRHPAHGRQPRRPDLRRAERDHPARARGRAAGASEVQLRRQLDASCPGRPRATRPSTRSTRGRSASSSAWRHGWSATAPATSCGRSAARSRPGRAPARERLPRDGDRSPTCRSRSTGRRPSCNAGSVTVAGACANLHAGSSLSERLRRHAPRRPAARPRRRRPRSLGGEREDRPARRSAADRWTAAPIQTGSAAARRRQARGGRPVARPGQLRPRRLTGESGRRGSRREELRGRASGIGDRREPARRRPPRTAIIRSVSASDEITEPLRDAHGRPISDLRVSVTDRCNFRCQYCMPADGLPWLERDEILTFEEIERLVAAARRGSGSRTCG